MSKKSPDCIRLRGVRQNNLKNIDLDVPLRKLVVISGLSGSGKSSLAFDTLFAEGQRRYIETFSPYARQFLDRMDKPRARRIEGIPPAIAIEQRNSVKSSRSTVGTMTEIADYAKVFWAQLARLHCRRCGQPVAQEPPQKIWPVLRALAQHADTLVTFTLDLSGKFSLEESLALIARQGYRRLLLDGEPVPLEEAPARLIDALPHRETNTGKDGASRLGTPNMLEETSRAIPPISPILPILPIPPFGFAQDLPPPASPPVQLTVIQDRVTLKDSSRSRFIEACEQAYHFGQGRLAVHWRAADGAPMQTRHFSNRLHCATCDLEYREPSPALFSFNHPSGACPACKGFGRVIAIDYNAAIPDRGKTLAGGAVKPWQTKSGAECQADMLKFAALRKVPVDTPFRDLSKQHQDWVIEGDPGYGKDKAHEWPRAWYGVKGYFRWLETKSYKMHVRVLLARYRKYSTCPDCHGDRFQPETLLYRIEAPCQLPLAAPAVEASQHHPSDPSDPSDQAIRNPQSAIRNSHPSHPAARALTLADFYRLPARDALRFVEALLAVHPATKSSDPRLLALNEVRSRLAFLLDAGLGYLSLDRLTRSLSGGETERVSLTSCLGSRLVNTLFVLDEPSVGLHPRDTARLVRIVRHLRDAGNTVVLVEHEAAVIRAADHIIDLGPSHGASGGEVVFQGTYREILRAPHSLTGQYLSGKKRIEIPPRRPVRLPRHEPGKPEKNSGAANPVLILRRATLHNLRNLTVAIPLARFVCVTGVSGSGKSTLVRDVLLPALQERLAGSPPANSAPSSFKSQLSSLLFNQPPPETEEAAPSSFKSQPSSLPSLEGWQHLGRVVAVDQSLLGRTPRSNPAVYIGAFDDIRQLFARTEAARQRGLNASAFSFNSAQGQCQRCRGAGFEKIEMQFLSDVFVRCPDCDGRRYRPHILEVTAEPPGGPSWNIAALLEATVDEAVEFLNRFVRARTPDGRAVLPRRPKLERSSSLALPSDEMSGLERSAQRAAASLQLLREVGLGYLRLGQPINTLSGGESQRLKLVSHLAQPGANQAETESESPELRTRLAPLNRSDPLLPPLHTLVEGRVGERRFSCASRAGVPEIPPAAGKPTLFIFDEPTTGLHFDDVRVLLRVFQRLVAAGHTVLVIEHNLDVIKSADWVIDLGPEGGEEGGKIVAHGTPEKIAASPQSHTGQALRGVLLPHPHDKKKGEMVMRQSRTVGRDSVEP